MSNTAGQGSDRESPRLVGALAVLFDHLIPSTLAEAEDELRSAGSDPEHIGARCEQLARELLRAPAEAAGEGRPVVPSRAHPPRRRGWLWAAAAGVLGGAMAWGLLRPMRQVPLQLDASAPRRESAPLLAHRLPPANGGAAPGGEGIAAQPEHAAPQPAQPGSEEQTAIGAATLNPDAALVRQPVVDVAAGTVVSANNADEHAELMSVGVRWAVRNGLRMTVVEPRPVAPPAAYQAATERYSGAVSLPPGQGGLVGYVAGLPFPAIDPNAAAAGLKIMWNHEYRPFATDDFEARDVMVESGTMGTGGSGMSIERRFVVGSFQRLFSNGRLYVDPHPELLEREPIRYRERLDPLRGPADLQGVGVVSIRYLDAARADDTWLYLPTLRRVRRLSAAQRSDALFGQDADLDSLLGFSGPVSGTSWRLLGEKVLLGCVHAQRQPVKWGDGSGDFAFDDVWEPRAVYVVEGVPESAQCAYGKRVLYIDRETWTVLVADIYDRKGALWKVWLNMFAARPFAPDIAAYGGGIGSPAAVMIDTQLLHATRMSAADGAADVGAWSFNQGATEQSFTIAALIEESH